MAQQVQFVLDSDTAKAVQGFLRVVDSQKKGERQTQRTTKAVRRQQRVMEKSRRAAQGLGKSFVSSLGPGSAALGAVTALTAAMREMRQEANEAGQRLEQAVAGRRELAQVASSPEELKRLRGVASDLRTKQGFTQKEAFNLTFSAASAGDRFVRQAQTFGRLRRIGFEPQAGIESVQKLQAAFGQRSAGDARSVLNKVLAAAAPSPVRAQDIASAASTASTSFQQIGGSAAGLLGTQAVFAEAFKSPEQAADRIKSISQQIIKKRSRISGDVRATGLDLLFKLPELAEQGRLKSGGGETLTLNKFLAESNAIQAAAALQQNEQAVRKRVEAVSEGGGLAGTERSPLQKRFKSALGDPAARAVLFSEQAEQRKNVVQERKLGTANKLADAVAASEVARLREQGAFRVNVLLSKAQNLVGRFVSGDKGFLRSELTSVDDPRLALAIARQVAPEQVPFRKRAAGLFRSLRTAQRRDVTLPGGVVAQFIDKLGGDTPGGRKVTPGEFQEVVQGELIGQVRSGDVEGAASELRGLAEQLNEAIKGLNRAADKQERAADKNRRNAGTE